MGDASAPRVKVEKGKGKMSREGTQGSSSDYFISGKLTANERFQHNFFDIKVDISFFFFFFFLSFLSFPFLFFLLFLFLFLSLFNPQ